MNSFPFCILCFEKHYHLLKNIVFKNRTTKIPDYFLNFQTASKSGYVFMLSVYLKKKLLQVDREIFSVNSFIERKIGFKPMNYCRGFKKYLSNFVTHLSINLQTPLWRTFQLFFQSPHSSNYFYFLNLQI